MRGKPVGKLALAALMASLALAETAFAEPGLRGQALKFFIERADHWLCLDSCVPPLTIARFAFDRSGLGEADRAALREVTAAINDETMKGYEQSYEVSCYADAVGTEAYNAQLSRERAQAVKAALAEAKPGRPIAVSGKGIHPDAQRGPEARVCVIEVTHTRGRLRN